MGIDSLDAIHLGFYGNNELKIWFEKEYTARVPTKLDLAKSCIRFKKS